MKESIIKSIVRSFFVAFFGFFGVLIACICIIALIASLNAGSSEKTLRSSFKVQVLPDAHGKRAPLSAHTPVILNIAVKGMIGSQDLTGEVIQKMLMESQENLLKNNPVKAILLQINTPGGSTFDTYDIYAAIMRYKQEHQIPIYAFVEGYCASGGMYIASAADKILSTPISEIGSVGVLYLSANLYNAAQKLGINPIQLSRGTHKTAMSPFSAYDPQNLAIMDPALNYYYNDFVDVVLKGRPKITKELLVNTYGANVYVAPTALEYGFIDDANSSYTATIKELAEVCKLDEYQVIQLDTKLSSVVDFIGSNQFFNPTPKITHTIDWGLPIETKLLNQPCFLYLP